MQRLSDDQHFAVTFKEPISLAEFKVFAESLIDEFAINEVIEEK